MNKKRLIELLKSDSTGLLRMIIENILDEELSKSIEKMDTNLIDSCLDLLFS